MHDDLDWLVIPQRVQYQLAVTVHRCLGHQFREFAAALSGPVHFLLPDQQSVIHCLIICAYLLYDVIICAIQLLTPNTYHVLKTYLFAGHSKTLAQKRCYVIVLYKSTFTYLLTYLLSYIHYEHSYTYTRKYINMTCAW